VGLRDKRFSLELTIINPKKIQVSIINYFRIL